jgi:DNA polymerase/3'-5' exonuclease PolX
MSDEWIKTLADRRRVKFTNLGLDESTFLTAQVEGNKVVYSIILTDVKSPLSREEVETHFECELSKR